LDTVNIIINPLGAGTSEGSGEYLRSASVTVKASPNTGYRFVEWSESGIAVSADSIYTFTIDTNKIFSANFELESYTITASVLPFEGGSTVGSGTYLFGEKVELTAISNTGYKFTSWTENDSIVSVDSSYQFSADKNRNVTANFELKSYAISAEIQPLEGGTVSGDSTYSYGSTAVLTATPNIGYSFVNWSENEITVSEDSLYSFSVTSGRNLTANFSLNNYLIETSSIPLSGGVTSGGGNFDAGEMVELTATPVDGYAFGYWSENEVIISYDSVYTFIAQNNRNLAANFLINQYNVKIKKNPPNGGNVTPDSTYDHGSLVVLNASPIKGWKFDSWSTENTILSIDTIYSFVIFEDRDINANFSKKIYSISAVSSPEEGGEIIGTGMYKFDSLVTLNAVPNAGWNFLHWEENGEIISSDSLLYFTAKTNRSFTAHFSKNVYSITANSFPEEGGAVSGDSTYVHGETVTLTAMPDSISGYDFVRWTEAGETVSANYQYSFTAERNRSLTAVFQLRNYNVELIPSPSNGGSVEGFGRYTHGDSVEIEAVPATGWLFANWTDGEMNISSSQKYSFQITENETLRANFAHEIYTIVSTSVPSDAGVVAGSGSFYYGQTAVLTPTANPGWEFDNWSRNGTVISTDSILVFEVTGDDNIKANYKMKFYSINCSSDPVEAGITGGCGLSLYNQEIIVRATPNNGWEFVNWTENGNIVSNEVIYQFDVTVDRNLVANFKLLTDIELEDEKTIPDDFYLSNAYPNPFNPSTKIDFGLPAASNVIASIYNINGQLVKNLISNITLPAGNYKTRLNGENLSSGIYLYVFIANSLESKNSFRKTEKLILLK
jgi:hypothetical protein